MSVFVASTQQAAYFTFVQDGEGSAIIDAKAGSGKTTTLIQGLRFMSGHVLMLAYNKKMAEELNDRTRGMPGVYSSTVHAAGYKGLRFAFKNNRLQTNQHKVRDIVEKWCELNQRADILEISPVICKTVGMAKCLGIGALPEFPNHDSIWTAMIDHFDLCGELPEDREDRIDQIIAMSRLVLKRSNADLDTVDFDDMVYLPLQRGIRMLQNDWVLLDEAQDTNPTRRALARKLLKPGGRLIAVGDPHQAIFGFTGADNDALQQIARDFRAITLPLSVSYRCPKKVIEVAQRWVPDIESHPDAPDGEYKSIKYEELLENVKVGEAILCRFNKYLVSTCFKLIRAGIPARIEGRAIGEGLIILANKWKTNDLDLLKGRVEKWRDREVKKALDDRKETKADQIEDKCETLIVLIERAQEQKLTKNGMIDMVRSMFDDNVVDRKDMVTLCSVHRSKGLEWPVVYVLGLDELMPSPYARQPWQLDQEHNLQYVAATRAMLILVNVTGVKEEKRKTP